MIRSAATIALALSVAFGAIGLACKSSAKWDHAVKKFLPQHMKVRRPVGKAADPKVKAGGEDFTSKPLPNERFDCEPSASIFKDLRVQEVYRCVSEVEKPILVTYRLVRSTQPVWTLVPDEGQPECLGKLLGQIPIPREIVFQTAGTPGQPAFERHECYAANIDVHADEWMGAKIPKNQAEMTLSLPLRRPKKRREPPKESDAPAPTPTPSPTPSVT